MKIAFYTDQTYLHGGIERVLSNKINYLLSETSHEVFLITSEQRGKSSCYQMHPNVKHHDLGINYNRQKSYLDLRNLLKAPKHFFRLKRKLKELQPDVLIICNYAFDFFFIPFLSRRTLKIKEYHSSRFYYDIERKGNTSFKKKIKYKIDDYIEAKYDYLVLLTDDEKQYYKSSNLVVIPNAITSYPTTSAVLEAKKIISAGRIAPVKGFEKLICCVEKVFKVYPDWSLEIYGGGDTFYINELKKLIAEKNLENHIRLCGSTSELDKQLLASSIYAMSSKTECFPMVLLESLSNGLPVVSFDCPNGPRNIVTDSVDGILVEDQNITELSQALLNLIGNEELRKKMGQKARKNMLRFKPEIVMKRWEALFLKNTN
ncbi:glycosyltransferase family 4 protein [Aquimarina sp. W85]|uniref:glycosyltransferase family 4 protein n=1 Tax=Aquimarina rhodophyticola TaxID=3342246 RepID=UPI00366D8017